MKPLYCSKCQKVTQHVRYMQPASSCNLCCEVCRTIREGQKDKHGRPYKGHPKDEPSS